MTLTATILESVERSFTLYRDLIDSLEAEALGVKLPDIRSNTVGEQFWCVIGARESYCRALKAGQWSGFSCSLETTTDKTAIEVSLRNSATELRAALQKADTFSAQQNRLLVDLLEHESAHQGQLIRYLYGLNLTIPASWKSRYALA